jgi:hypothetical protein
MHLKSCQAANDILPVPRFEPHTAHKSTRTHWSQRYEDITRGQTGNRRNGCRASIQYADLEKNTWMKTLIQEAPFVHTSTTPASEDTRSQLQRALINHLTRREIAILPTPLATQPHTAHRTTLTYYPGPRRETGTRKKRKQHYRRHSVLWKYSLEWESHEALAVNTEHSTPPSGDRMQRWSPRRRSRALGA